MKKPVACWLSQVTVATSPCGHLIGAAKVSEWRAPDVHQFGIGMQIGDTLSNIAMRKKTLFRVPVFPKQSARFTTKLAMADIFRLLLALKASAKIPVQACLLEEKLRRQDGRSETHHFGGRFVVYPFTAPTRNYYSSGSRYFLNGFLETR